MKRFSYILAVFTVLWALLTAAIPWCSPVVAGYLAPLGLLVIPLAIFSILATIIAVLYRSKSISLLFGTACLISLFLCGKSWAVSFETDESYIEVYWFDVNDNYYVIDFACDKDGDIDLKPYISSIIDTLQIENSNLSE